MTTRTIDGILHCMSEPRTAVLPLFRSANQAAIVGCLFTEHDREWSGPELVEATGASQQTVSREIRSLRDAGLVTVRRVGNTMLAQADRDAAVFGELVGLAHKTYGPIPLLREALANVKGVEGAAVFGSWAARFLGRRGHVPHDIDVLVLTGGDHDDIYVACAQVEARIGMKVQPTIYTPEEWAADASGFAREVRASDVVPLFGFDDGLGGA